jgi:YidC/Oxa1 family membrane protein insertase
MLRLLEFLYSFTGSWGLAIILLTLLIRLVLHPLTQKKMNSMQKMQKLQPRLKVLQEKFKNDKDALNRETMALYKENKINPAAGCLPLLVQLPIFILLYRSLTAHDFSGATFLTVQLDGSVYSTLAKALQIGLSPEAISILRLDAPAGELGITIIGNSLFNNASGLLNFTLWLPNAVLLAVISFLTWYQQKLSAAGNPQMAMMTWFLPVFMTFICLNLPGGVLLYWGVSSLLGVVHQAYMSKKTKLEMEEKPLLFKDKPAERK